jgi:tetratricopeptide (TPR) repeat protein
MDTGDNETALGYLRRALELARENDERLLELYALINLAELWLRFRDWDDAREALSRAEELAAEMDFQRTMPGIDTVWARFDLATDHYQHALERAERSCRLAQEFGEQETLGVGLRVWGQALLANGQRKVALDKFEQSLAYLEDIPLDAARTRMHYGLALLSDGDVDKGRALLEQARTAFQELGAKHDLTELEELAGDVGTETQTAQPLSEFVLDGGEER